MRLTYVLAILLLTGCAARPVRAPQPSAVASLAPGFLDLKPGWRLRVVVPILKSGGYRIPSLQSNSLGSGSLQAGPDFVGYENDYYAILSNGPGVTIKFQSAEAVKDGKSTAQLQPLASLFELPRNIRYVRLVYLVRVSDADHNMAIVGAEDPDTLARITTAVQTDPDRSCTRDMRSFCSWVPAGIAVRPQQLVVTDGEQDWVP